MRNARRLFLVALLVAGTLNAQVAPTPGPTTPATAPVRRPPPSLGILPVGLGLGAVALLSLVDEPLRDALQDHRTARGDDLARTFRRVGEPVVYLPVALGTVAVGLVAGRPAVTRAGGRIAGSLLVAGLATNLIKPVVGRRRPNGGTGAYDFSPLGGWDSWPSGHTTMAFALATSVSDEVHSLPVTVALYGAATMTAWSRMNDDRHWLTDVVTGAAIGTLSAKVINGRLRVFGVGGPRFLLEPGRVGLTATF